MMASLGLECKKRSVEARDGHIRRCRFGVLWGAERLVDFHWHAPKFRAAKPARFPETSTGPAGLAEHDLVRSSPGSPGAVQHRQITSTSLPGPVSILDEAAVRKAVQRMGRELVARNGGTDDLVLIGIQRRGVQIAALLREAVAQSEGVELPLGTLDITFYRDDLGTVGPLPVVGSSELPADGIEGRSVALVDDVLFSGRTARAGLNELMDWGRPSKILLVVLIDRGGRELPIQPDVVGTKVEALPGQRVDVLVPDLDGALGAVLTDRVESP